MRAASYVLVVVIAWTLAMVAATRPAAACCPAYPQGHPVRISDQEILITWDPETRVERFVRRATFSHGDRFLVGELKKKKRRREGARDNDPSDNDASAAASGFGFLVPTPSIPTVSGAPDRVFSALAERTRPIEVVETVYEVSLIPALALLFLGDEPEEKVASRGLSVEVLGRQHVAGYDAAILAADDAQALRGWLADNGYDVRPDLEEWVQPYIAARWTITAFKLPSEGYPIESTEAVCMTFETDRPLFPYRVPKDQLSVPGAGSLLRVYYVGDARAAGSLGVAKNGWAGMTKFAAEIEGIPALLAGVAPADALPQTAWLTKFEDAWWPSGTEDLFFERAADPSPIIPTTTQIKKRTIIVPPDVILALGGLGFWGWRRRRRSSP